MMVHFYTFGDENAGSSRQRGFRLAAELQKRGIETVIHYPPVVYLARTRWPKKASLIFQIIRSLFSIGRNDIVYLQRTTYSKYFFVIMVLYLRLFRRKMIFDFDDPIYTHSYTKTRVFTQIANAVITCTHAQAEWAKKFNNRVTVAHIAIDPTPYGRHLKKHTQSDEPILGWVGSGPEHLQNFQIIVPVFRTLVQKGVRFKFVLVGALKDQRVYELFNQIPGLNVEFINSLDWKDPEAVPREISKFDIGILPHQSSGAWNMGKTSLKNLEYMACGVPAVCSNFGEMPRVITTGVNGFLCTKTEEWVETLERLIKEPNLRESVGAAGRELVQKSFSFAAVMPKVEGVIRTLM